MLRTRFHRILRLMVLALLLPVSVVYGQVEDTTIVVTTVAQSHFDEAVPPSLAARRVPDSTVSRIRKDDDYWYANLAPERPKEKKEAQPDRSRYDTPGWLQSLIWLIVIGGFIAALIWYLASSNIRLFRKKPKSIPAAGEDSIPEDIFEIPYEKEIARAEAAGNYRLATRLHYLDLLRELSLRGLISFTQEKTNSDYLRQLQDSPQYRPFFQLTREFEYTWYGKFPLAPQAYERVRSDFQQFKQNLG